jgi:hypothetical protein
LKLYFDAWPNPAKVALFMPYLQRWFERISARPARDAASQQ